MTAAYDFGWLREEAAQVKYGTMTVELKVHDGQVVLGTILSILRQRSLKDTQRPRVDELIA